MLILYGLKILQGKGGILYDIHNLIVSKWFLFDFSIIEMILQGAFSLRDDDFIPKIISTKVAIFFMVNFFYG